MGPVHYCSVSLLPPSLLLFLSPRPLSPFLSQDKQIWEDLGDLEGRIGTRYLTHETEDAFWKSRGARPHPLAKAEAERRAQLKLEQQQQLLLQQMFEGKSPKVNFVEPDQVSNTSSRSQGSQSGTVFPESGSEPKSGGSDAEQNQDTTTKKKKRKDYLSMTDEEIIKAQQHAERVGYKVTTV